MKLLADESIDAPIVARLRQAGHEVEYVAEVEPSIPDEIVLNLANEKMAMLLTGDKDFGELVFRQRRVHQGVILIRLGGLSPMLKAEIVVSTINTHLNELSHVFAVIMPGAIRIRSPGK